MGDTFSLEAETALVGSMARDHRIIPEVTDELVVTDLFSPACATAFTELVESYDEDGPWAETGDLLVRLFRRGKFKSTGQLDAVWLSDAMAQGWSPEGWHLHATEISRLARLRELQAAAATLAQHAAEFASDPEAVAASSLALLENLMTRAGNGEQLSMNADDLLATDTHYDWVVPNLLEHRERVIFTGWEGLGKSLLLRQMAVCAAVGRHPFTFEPHTPANVLWVDLENGVTTNAREFDVLIAHGITQNPNEWDADRLRFEHRDGGIDLTQPRDAAWLLRRVTVNKPDILVIGSLYRMADADQNSDETARRVQRALDMCRTRTGCAILIEAHAGHGDARGRQVRPRGSSLWLGWPNFGFGIRPAVIEGNEQPTIVDLTPFRGGRDRARPWPERLEHGKEGQWPWREYLPYQSSGRWAA